MVPLHVFTGLNFPLKGRDLEGHSLGGEALGTHAVCWRQGRLSPDPSCALGWKEACETPASALGNRQGSGNCSLQKYPEENHRLRHQGEPLPIPLCTPSLAELSQEA